jgi:sporulation protein YlmC with PRC-barrel domain
MLAEDWQSLVSKPVFASDGKDIGVVSQILPEELVATSGQIIPST